MWHQMLISQRLKHEQVLAEAQGYGDGRRIYAGQNQGGAESAAQEAKSYLRRLGESLGLFGADREAPVGAGRTTIVEAADDSRVA